MGAFAQKVGTPGKPLRPGSFAERVASPRGGAGSGTAQASPEFETPKAPSRLQEAFGVAGEATGLPAMTRVIEGAVDPDVDISGWDAAQVALMPLGAVGLLKGGATAGQAAKLYASGVAGSGAGQYALGPEARSLAEKIRGEDPGRIRKLAAGVVEAAPSIAGGIAAPIGFGKLGQTLRGGEPLKKVVPQGQEVEQLLKVAQEKFSLPAEVVPAAPTKTTGQLRDVFSAGREIVGAPVTAAKEAAYAAAKTPRNLAERLSGALEEGLTERKVPKLRGRFEPELAESPAAAKEILKIKETVVPRIKNLTTARALQTRLAKAAEEARRPKSPTSEQSATLSAAERALDKTIKSFIPEKQLGDLEQVNKGFSQFAKLHQMVMDSSTQRGNFSVQKFIKQWNEMKPSDKAKRFSPEQVQAMDSLMTQPQPGAISKIADVAARGIQIIGARTLGRGTQLGRMMEKPISAPPRFYRELPSLRGALAPASIAENLQQFRESEEAGRQ